MHHAPKIWTHAPLGLANAVLSTSGTRNEPTGTVFAIDLERSAEISSVFLGHGGYLNKMSVSAGDLNTFATACSDGLARLFDIRQALPVLTFNGIRQAHSCQACVFIHPDGIPSKSIPQYCARATLIFFSCYNGWRGIHQSLGCSKSCCCIRAEHRQQRSTRSSLG